MLRVNAIKLRFFCRVGCRGNPLWLPAQHRYGTPNPPLLQIYFVTSFQRVGGFRSTLPTLQKKRIYA